MAVPADTPAAARSPAAAVRKSVTALFGDLVGSTSFGEQVDPEAVRAALAPYFDILRSTIEHHAGAVVKFTGDGIMAIFGLPEVAEDDALRAVAAGLEIQRRFRAFAESVRDRHGVELGMRVGINTGELVISDTDEDLVGDVLNTAARLEASCQPGRVTVGEDTWRLTRSSITYEVLGEVRVKGKADALATFQVVDTGMETVEENIPFVGRATELADVRAVFDEAVASATCRLVTVIGAPGVGKTRLASELRSGIEARSFDLRFERRGSTTFAPLVELLRELTGSGTRTDVARLVGGHSEADRLTGVLSSFMGHGESRSTEESFWAVRRLLEHLAVDEPVVIVVDDIQWAEPLFWDLLDHLAEWVSAPVTVLALARPELRELRPELTQPGRRIAASISLEGLDADTTRELAERLLDTDELPADLIERIPLSTEGNPLFVRELMQMLVDDGVLARTGGRWHLTIDVDAIEVPPTILSLLASRVERLPDDERQVVELASVIGTEFDRGLLGSIAGDDITARLGVVTDRLRRKDLVEPSGTWAGDHPVYRFHHVLVRDAAYRRLLKGRRADLHERVGRHLEEQGQSGYQADVVIAHHYEQVHRYRSELGTVDQPTRLLAGQAMRRLRSAAEQALAHEDLASAGGYGIRALALADDGDARDELLVLGCEALLSSGDVARGAPLVDELLTRDLNERLAAWADCFRAQLWSLTDSDRLSEASQLTAESADRLEALGDPAGVAKARLVRAVILARLGRIGDCEDELDLALAAARAAGDRRRTVAVLGAAPLAALWGPSPVARAGGRCLDVLRLLRITTTSPAVEATSIRCQGMLEALRGRFESARAKFEISRTTARDLGLRHGLYETELFEGFVELLAGDPVAAEPHLLLARDGLGALGIGADAGQAGALLARSLLQQGRVDEADQLAIDALASAGQNLQTAIASRSVLAEIRAVQGRHDEARPYADEAIEIAGRTDVILDHALALQAAARVARRAGDTGRATRLEGAVQGLFHDKGVTMGGGEPVAAVPEEQEDGSDGPEATPPLAPNAAWEVNEGLWETWIADDRAGYLALLAPDFLARIHEFGPRLAFSGDRDATADVLFESLADDRVKAIPNRLVAVRGDDLALIAMTFQGGGSTTTMYAVSQVRDGRAVRADTFAEDQLGDAHDELDRRWVTLGAPAEEVELLIELRRSSADGDFERFRELLADDFEAVGHGRVALLARRSVDEFIESLRPLFGDGGVAISVIADVPAITAGIALTRYHLDVADGSEWRVWYLWQWESGRLARADIYELEFYEAALARFEELHSEPPIALPEFSNNAYEWVVEFDAALNANDADRMRAMLHPEFEMLAESEFFTDGFGAEETVDWYLTGLATGQSADEELVAIRGDDHCLVRLFGRADGYENEYLGVITIRDGQAVRHRWFDPETQLTEAHQDLDRAWLDSLGFAENHAIRRLAAAAYSVDPDEILSTIHPNIEYREHRRLSYAIGGDYDQFAANTSTMHLIDHAALPVVHRVSDSAVLCQRDEIGSVGGAMSFLMVVSHLDGLCITYDVYDLEDLDAALARYDELADASTRSGGWNRAATIATRAISLVARDGFEIHRDLFATQYVQEDRRLRPQPSRGDTAASDELMSWMSNRGSADVDVDTIAVRGDSLCVQRWRCTFDPGDEIEYLVLTHLDGHDRVAVSISFDPEQIVDVHRELDRLWLDELGWPADHIAWNKLGEAYETDPERAAASLHLKLEFVNHRRLAYESGGASTLADVLRSTHFEMIVTMPRIHRLSELGAVVERVETAVDEIGENRMIIVVIWEDGLSRHLEGFDVDDLDRAIARYDELTGRAEDRSSTDAGATDNSVWQRVLRFRDAWNANDRDRCLEVLGDGATFEGRQHGHTGIVFSGEELVDLMFEQELFGDASSREFRLIASRGDDLCLYRIDENVNGIEIRSLNLIDGGGDAYGIRLFRYDVDQLAEATAELDRLHARIRPDTPTFTNAAWERHLRFRAAWLARDRELCRTILGDEFEVVPLHNLSTGYGFGRDEFLHLIFDHDDLEIDAETVVDTLVAIRGDDLCLYRNDETSTSGTGVRYWLNDKASSRLYRFDETQLVEAQMMLDRLWFDSLGFGADHTMRTVGPAAYAVDPEAAMAIAHPEVAYREHRRLSFEGGGRAELTARTSSLPLVDHIIVPVVHRISDVAALFHKDEINVDGGTSSMLIVTTLRDGLAGSYDIYELDDLDAAIARYDELTVT